MDLNVGKELAALNRMSVDALRARYAEVFGEPTNGRHKQWLGELIDLIGTIGLGDAENRSKDS